MPLGEGMPFAIRDISASIEADSCMALSTYTGGRKLVAPFRVCCTMENQETEMRRSAMAGPPFVVKSSVKVASSPFSVWGSAVSTPSASSSISA